MFLDIRGELADSTQRRECNFFEVNQNMIQGFRGALPTRPEVKNMDTGETSDSK
jgi:hypothetical protein